MERRKALRDRKNKALADATETQLGVAIAPDAAGNRQCPECHSAVAFHMGYVTWCPNCDWNVRPYDPEPPRNSFEKMYIALGKKLGRQLFEALLKDGSLSAGSSP